jgi:ZIP family zinc transporter
MPLVMENQVGRDLIPRFNIIIMDLSPVLIAFMLTLLAGLSTGIGSFLAFFTRHTNTKLLSFSLGFSAGIMLYVSFVEIFFEAKESLVLGMGDATGYWLTVAAFFGGIALIGLIDRIVPSYENPHEVHRVEEIGKDGKCLGNKRLLRTGLFVALAITIHNFPEGLVTFTAALKEVTLGVTLAIAIAIHNIPEGIAVSVPIYCATGSKSKAFAYSFLSGLAEPLGALIGFAILLPFLNDTVFGILFAAVAGIMVFISLDQLLPSSRAYGQHHLSVYGLFAGMAVMAMSLLLL